MSPFVEQIAPEWECWTFILPVHKYVNIFFAPFLCLISFLSNSLRVLFVCESSRTAHLNNCSVSILNVTNQHQMQRSEDDENSNVAMATAVDRACGHGDGNQVAGQENNKYVHHLIPLSSSPAESTIWIHSFNS